MKRKIVIGFVVFALAFMSLAFMQRAEAVSKAYFATTYDAEIRTSNVDIPTRMEAGKKYRVRVTVKNNGTIKWEGHPFALSSRIYRGPSGSATQRDELTPLVDLKGAVDTNGSHTFEYYVEAPNYAGTYELEWSMMRGSTKFGDKVRRTITVTN